jgi:hypothetical protein
MLGNYKQGFQDSSYFGGRWEKYNLGQEGEKCNRKTQLYGNFLKFKPCADVYFIIVI